MIRASGDEVRRVGAESAIPDPSLVAGQGCLQWERMRIAIVIQLGGFLDIDLPDFRGMVRGAGGQLLDVRRKENTSNIVLVSREVRDGLQLGAIEVLD